MKNVNCSTEQNLNKFLTSFLRYQKYGFLQCLWRFINSVGILMLFSISFEIDLVLLHSKANPVFHFIDV